MSGFEYGARRSLAQHILQRVDVVLRPLQLRHARHDGALKGSKRQRNLSKAKPRILGQFKWSVTFTV